MIEIERAVPDDRPAIDALLTANGLPLAGLELAWELTLVARADGTVAGCAAIEPHGSVGLLRPVCVAESERGPGARTEARGRSRMAGRRCGNRRAVPADRDRRRVVPPAGLRGRRTGSGTRRAGGLARVHGSLPGHRCHVPKAAELHGANLLACPAPGL